MTDPVAANVLAIALERVADYRKTRDMISMPYQAYMIALAAEIERLNADMAWIRRRTGFHGEVPAELPPSRDLIDYGYAPGQYSGKCLDCMHWMDFVDKRCHVCKPCAEKRRDRAAQPPGDG